MENFGKIIFRQTLAIISNLWYYMNTEVLPKISMQEDLHPYVHICTPF